MQQSQFPSAHFRPTTASLRVAKLIVQRAGTFNQMYYRPYQTTFNADVAMDLADRLQHHGQAADTTSAVMAGIANRLMMPSHQPVGMAGIANGWDTPRGRFTMVVEMRASSGAEFEYHVQGYTDHFDVSIASGLIDPNMAFYVNSYLKLSKSHIATPTGIREHLAVTESAQVINGRIQTTQVGGELYSMRPTDIFGVMQGETIRSKHLPMEMRSGVADDRHVLTHKAIASARGNNLPANVLSKIVSSYATGQLMANTGIGNEDVYSRSRPYVYETTLQENPLFRQLSNIRGIPESTVFTLNNLLSLDPNATHPSVATFITLDPNALAMVHHTGQTETWQRPDDVLAWISTVLASSVPTIMMEMRLTRLDFSANNHDSQGFNTVIINGVRDIMERSPQRDDLEAFKMRFIHEVMRDITHNNETTYMLHMSVDLFGETLIDISFGGSPMVRYAVPSFCDAVMSPVLSPQENILFNTAHDVTQILGSIHGTVRPTALNESI